MALIKYKLRHANAIPPVRHHEGDAGWDVACIEDVEILPWENKMISTGLQIEMPPGYYCQLAARSGLTLRCGLQVLAGVIDRSYQGIVKVVAYNASHTPLFFKKHTRIAQMLFIKIAEPCTMVAGELAPQTSTRQGKGFGNGSGLLL